jgi:hypothetical protein
MSKSAENRPDWAAEWIEQQRKKLGERGAASGSTQDPMNVLGTFFQSFTHGFKPESGNAPDFSQRTFGPPLGLMREHEQAWRDLGEAQARYRGLEAAVFAQLNAVQLEALALLERRVASKPVKDMRELYDRWVECGEEVYARCVRSDAYCKAQAALANAASELRLKQQAIIEGALRMFDLPTRSEINSVHRQLRELKEAVNQLSATHVNVVQTPRAKTSSAKTPRSKAIARRASK